MATCPQCQHSNPPSARFCNSCGARLAHVGSPVRSRASSAAAPRKRSFLGRSISVVLWLMFMLGLPAGLVYLLGFSMKSEPEYRCAMSKLAASKEVKSAIGSPFEPGTFAWVSAWETSGAISQGHFSTSIAGPKGEGSVDVTSFRAAASSSFLVTLEVDGKTRTIYKGDYPCD